MFSKSLYVLEVVLFWVLLIGSLKPLRRGFFSVISFGELKILGLAFYF